MLLVCVCLWASAGVNECVCVKNNFFLSSTLFTDIFLKSFPVQPQDLKDKLFIVGEGEGGLSDEHIASLRRYDKKKKTLCKSITDNSKYPFKYIITLVNRSPFVIFISYLLKSPFQQQLEVHQTC